MIITLVEYKLKQGDNWMPGIMINEDKYIIDENGKRLKTIFSYYKIPHEFSINLEPLFEKVKESNKYRIK